MKKILHLIIVLIIVISTIPVLVGCTSTHNYSEKLIKAIETDDYDTFDELLKEGKNLDSTPYQLSVDRVNMPPLHFACSQGKVDFVKKLVEAGADINNTDIWNGHTPLMQALESNSENRLVIAAYLIEKGANVKIEAYRRTALDYAFSYNVNNYSEKIENEDFQFALYLLEQGLTIDDVSLGNVIFNAAQNNNTLMVNHMIGNLNVDIDIQDVSYGNTSLMWAVQKNCYNVAKYLINNGANLDIVNNEGKTAKDIALKKNNQDIIDLFE